MEHSSDFGVVEAEPDALFAVVVVYDVVAVQRALPHVDNNTGQPQMLSFILISKN